MSGTVLIVDDESMCRDTVESILEGQGYTLEMAENGPQALEKARLTLPDAILLDVMMPGMTGFEVCSQIRGDTHLAEVPIIFTTALNDRMYRLQGLAMGADEYMTKPLDRHELRTRLAGIVRLNRYRKLLEERESFEQVLGELLSGYDATMEDWSRAMELRDGEAEGHIQRVTELTLRLAKAMGLDEDQLIHIRRGALLHDIGKLDVPDAILSRTGTLSGDDWNIMRMHPQYGYDMLSHISYLHPALDIPYCHHEKWDGTGYPRGLKGEEIPFAARLFAIVDAWDALSTALPDRPAWSRGDALAYLGDQAGSHFDPKVVDLFSN